MESTPLSELIAECRAIFKARLANIKPITVPRRFKDNPYRQCKICDSRLLPYTFRKPDMLLRGMQQDIECRKCLYRYALQAWRAACVHNACRMCEALRAHQLC